MVLPLHTALKRMRELTTAKVPFTFQFYTYSEVNNSGGEIKTVQKAFLRKGYRDEQSEKAGILVAYEDLDANEKNKQFYLPLLKSLNGYQVQL